MLTTSMLSTQYTKGNSLLELENGINLATKISEFVHSTQKERGLSSGFLVNHGKKFKEELLQQREITDLQVKQLTQYLSIIKDNIVISVLKQALHDLKKLKDIRVKVDNFKITFNDNITLYSRINDSFLNIIIEISKISKEPKITQNIIAYSNFLYAKEHAGVERAIGTVILSSTTLNQNIRVDFTNLISIQRLYIKNFLKYVSNEGKSFYFKNLQNSAVEEVDNIRKAILYKNPDESYGYTAQYWFATITKKIDLLQRVDSYLEKELLTNITTELESTYTLFGGFALLNIISIIIFLVMIILIVKLLKSEKRLRNIIDKYIISSSTDLKGKITEVSDAFCDISGYTRDELIGKPHNIIRHPDMPKNAFKDLWNTIQQGKSWNGKVKNLKKNGGYYWVYANVEPLFDKKGKIEGYAAIRLDITDSVELQQEIERGKQKDKTLFQQSKLAQMGEMISMIAHQWRQPLTAISATSSDLFMKIMLDNYDKKYFNEKLENIDELSQHLSSTIDDFRNFYKEDKKKEYVLYSDIVKGALQIVETSLKDKKVNVSTNFNCQAQIYTLPNELRQVILNLIKNAEDVLIEKEVENPSIGIRTYDDESYSYLEIQDNGGGIPDEIIEKIFDPYFSTKTKKDGTGLGLYMSQIIVRDHSNGELLISNSGDGACFTIKIPISKGGD
jgi:PAS domain S-box-containing protein